MRGPLIRASNDARAVNATRRETACAKVDSRPMAPSGGLTQVSSTMPVAMKLGQVCSRNVPCIRKTDRAAEAARRMHAEGIDELVVVEELDGRKVPVGSITDRDIVVGLVARNIRSLGELTVRDVLFPETIAHEIVTAADDEDVDDVIARMRSQGIRRMPVVDASGALVGLFTLHDALELLEFMDRRPTCLSEKDSARQAALLMRDEGLDLIPVCDAAGRMTGTITDRDLVTRLAAADASLDLPLKDVMTRDPVVFTVRDELSTIEQLLVGHHKSRIVCVDEDGRPVCVVSLAELARLEDARLRRRMHRPVREHTHHPQ
ncbi:MAG TPA: CBS domain-containing protein [Candidatus Margulisiibacteriota bacterium]|nr:CBS domain-containing protein [Candidatus Margulisiibacteriota bacterium]